MLRHPRDRHRPGPARRPPQRGLEEILGGRVLAWVGGVAILLGIVFLLGIAIDRGWIDEPMRTVLGLLGSTSLLLAGVWLYERKGRTEAALAAVASALSGLYTTLLVGTQIYDLIPAEAGLACAGLVGIVGAALAVRWKSMVVAAIGILGALLAPVLVDSGTSGAFPGLHGDRPDGRRRGSALAEVERALAWGLHDLGAAASGLVRRQLRRATAGLAGRAGWVLGALRSRRDRLRAAAPNSG